MTTNLNFTSDATETLPGGTYSINQTGGSVTLKFLGPSTIDNDTVQGSQTNQTLDFDIMRLNGTMQINGEIGTTTLDGDILNNRGKIVGDGGNIIIDTKVLGGRGMEFMGNGADMTVNGIVGGGQTFNIVYPGGGLTIDNPNKFFGHINLQGWPDFVDLANIVATSYNYRNDILTLWNGNKVVDRVDVTSNNISGSTFGPHPLFVFQHPPVGSIPPGVEFSSFSTYGFPMLPIHT